MSDGYVVEVLLVEDTPSDVLLVEHALGTAPGADFHVSSVSNLGDALERLETSVYDVILVDLGLPDSSGLSTFESIREHAPEIPLLVLTALTNEEMGIRAVKLGAQDFLVKSQLQTPLLGRFIRFAIERHRLQKTLEDLREKEERDREMQSMERLSAPPATMISAGIYSGGSLREKAPEVFKALVDRYAEGLDAALEDRVHRGASCRSEPLLELGIELGFLRANPRDVLDVHLTALKLKTQQSCWKKAQGYAQEGRLLALELMGNLAGYYRGLTAGVTAKEICNEQ